MAVTLDVDAILANGLGQWLAERRDDRIAIQRKYRLLVAASIFGGFALFLFSFYAALHPKAFGVDEVPPLLVVIGILVSIVGGIVGAVLSYQIKVDAVDAMKREMNGAIAGAMGIRYAPKGKPGDAFDLAHAFQLFPRFNRRVCEDFWEGEFGDIRFRIFEVALTNGSGKTTTTPFRGVLIYLQTPHAYNGATVVRRSSPWQRWTKTPIALRDMTLAPVEIGEGEFGRKFMVYSTDPGIAHSIATSSYCERLMALENRFVDRMHALLLGRAINILYYGQHLVIAVGAKNLFETAGFSASADRVLLERTINQLRGVFDLAENVDRHGTKLTGD